MSTGTLGIDALRGLVSLAMKQLSMALGLSALAIIGAVYFIVDMSLRGIEKSIDVTNKRIDDLDKNLSGQFNQKIDSLERILRIEFSQTREVIRRGALDVTNQPSPIFQDPALTGSPQIQMVDLANNKHLILSFYGDKIPIEEFIKASNNSNILTALNERTFQKPSLAVAFSVWTDLKNSGNVQKLVENSILLRTDKVNAETFSKLFPTCIVRRSQSNSGDIFLELNQNATVFENAGFACKATGDNPPPQQR
jgi:hypothetical protein